MSNSILITAGLALATSAIAQNPMALLGQGYTPETGGVPIEGPFLRPRNDLFPGIPSNAPLAAGGFSSVVAVRFTGHVLHDVAFLANNHPFYSTAPGLHSHAAPLPGLATTNPVRDLAVLVGDGSAASPNPAQDALVLGGDDGLHIWRFDPKYGTSSTEQVGGTEWSDVDFLATHPTDIDVIFGVGENGLLRVAERNSTTGLFQNAGTFAITGSALGLAAIDWDADGQSEVAILTTTGLTVRTRLGTQLGAIAATRLSGDLTLVRSTLGVGPTGVMEERIAWLRPDTTPPAELVTFGSNTQSVIALPEPFVAISAGDWSNDFDEDVALASATNNDVSVLINLVDAVPTNPFLASVTTGVRVAVAPDGTGRNPNGCAPVIADFDCDQDTDLWMPIEADNLGDASRILVIDKSIDVATAQPIRWMSYNVTTGDAQIDFPHIGANETHSEVTIWKVELDGKLNPVPFVNEYVPYTGTIAASVTFNLDPSHWEAGGEFSYMIRPVQRVNGVTVAVGLASLFGAPLEEGETGGIENTGPPPSDPPLEPPPGDPPPDPGD